MKFLRPVIKLMESIELEVITVTTGDNVADDPSHLRPIIASRLEATRRTIVGFFFAGMRMFTSELEPSVFHGGIRHGDDMEELQRKIGVRKTGVSTT